MEFVPQLCSFIDGEVIPTENTGEGEDLSPSLGWSGVPEGTAELVLTVEDPDAPQAEPWVHWLLFKIPPTISRLPEGIDSKGVLGLPPKARQGINSWGRIGYGGPLPPKGHGWHRYFFQLFAVDKEIELPPGATKPELMDEIEGHVIAKAQLVGRYRREASLGDARRAG